MPLSSSLSPDGGRSGRGGFTERFVRHCHALARRRKGRPAAAAGGHAVGVDGGPERAGRGRGRLGQVDGVRARAAPGRRLCRKMTAVVVAGTKRYTTGRNKAVRVLLRSMGAGRASARVGATKKQTWKLPKAANLPVSTRATPRSTHQPCVATPVFG